MRLAHSSVAHPTATFSATAPAGPPMPHEARMIKTVAASHIVGVLLSECVQRGTIGTAQTGARSTEQQCEPKADDTKRHDTILAYQQAYDCSRKTTRPMTFPPSAQCQQCSGRWRHQCPR
jgi:hypothetical protein